jgi:hypothetical protein
MTIIHRIQSLLATEVAQASFPKRVAPGTTLFVSSPSGNGVVVEDDRRPYPGYRDTLCPTGYDTNYSFLSSVYPEDFEYLYDPVEDLAIDHGKLRNLTEECGMIVLSVEAPTTLKERGIATTLAFPEVILDQFYT